jgi:transcriptional regulator with AAA-type ATPase domain/tetratricopeptide (TPR) repeat protein
MMLGGLVGNDRNIQAIRAQAARLFVAQKLPPVLIQGETGTGKTLLARELHAASPRARGPFVSVNCAAIPEQLIEAELFGVERGAFTDAREARPGLLQSAHRGTIFLDEVGYLPVRLQPKLLTVIETWNVRRVGGTRSETIDAWLVAATSEDLERAMHEQRFLRALYHRLAVMTFHVPPLRERTEDVPPIAERLLADVCRTYGLPRKRLTGDALAELSNRAWPGNIRELGNVIERAALLGDGADVSVAMLGLPREERGTSSSSHAPGRYRKRSADEKAELERTLADAGGNISEAARLLDLPRNTLRYRLQRHGLVADLPAPQPSATKPSLLRWEKQKVAFLAGAGSTVALDTLDEKIELFGGRVLDRGAARTFAVFGLGAVEDGARRAVLAALTAIRAVAEPLSLGLDVDDVEVARGDDDLTMGSHGLARARAVPHDAGGVFLTLPAEQAVRRYFRIASDGERRLVDPAQAAPTGALANALVGRAPELSLLQARAETAGTGTGQIVGVVGLPGIGKSRLIEELKAWLDRNRFVVLEARCAAHATGFAYHPIAGLVRAAAGLGDGCTAEEARAALAPLTDNDDSSQSYLLHVLGLDEPSDRQTAIGAEAFRARGLAAVRAVLFAAARERSLVVVVEDVHWADPSSRAALDFLVERMSRAPLLVVVTYRPTDEPSFMSRPFSTRIALTPLSRNESRGLLDGVLPEGEIAAPARDDLVERAEGNPLFLEELALAVRAGAALSVVPESLHGILRVRMERLAPAERRVLQVASVLGREVQRELLERVWDGPEPLGPLLDSLDRSDLLYRAGETLQFKHALTRDVAYDTLIDAERSSLHARAARTIEATHRSNPSEGCELVAYHYARSADHDKAVEFLVLAQAKAYRRFALEQSVAHFRQALERLDALPETEDNIRRRFDLLICHCDGMGYLARIDQFRAYLDKATALARRLGDPASLARVRSRRGCLFWWTGAFHEIVDEIEPNLRFAADSTAEEYNSGVWLLYACYVLGRYDTVVDLAPRLLAKLEERGSVIHKAYAHGVYATTLAESGRLHDGIRQAELAHADARRVGDVVATCFTAWVTSRIHCWLGQFPLALALADRAVESAVTPLDCIYAHINHGWVASRAGRHSEAALAEIVESVALATPMRFTLTAFWCAVPDALLKLGRTDEAYGKLEEDLAIVSHYGMPPTAAAVRRRLGEIALARGDLPRARAALEVALRDLEGTGAGFERTLVFAALGDLVRREGDVPAGEALLRDAFAELERMGAAPEAERVRALL